MSYSRPSLAALCLVLAPHAATADPVATYKALEPLLAPMMQQSSPEDLDRAATLVAGIGGPWAPLHAMTAMGGASADAVAQVCGNMPTRFTPNGRFEFTVEQPFGPTLREIHYSYAGGLRFTRSQSANQVIENVQLEPGTPFYAPEVFNRLASVTPLVSILQPEPDLLLMFDTYGQAEAWARCPG